jgi:hypothetical protein
MGASLKRALKLAENATNERMSGGHRASGVPRDQTTEQGDGHDCVQGSP